MDGNIWHEKFGKKALAAIDRAADACRYAA